MFVNNFYTKNTKKKIKKPKLILLSFKKTYIDSKRELNCQRLQVIYFALNDIRRTTTTT